VACSTTMLALQTPSPAQCSGARSQANITTKSPATCHAAHHTRRLQCQHSLTSPTGGRTRTSRRLISSSAPSERFPRDGCPSA
jgi:hypothetical protein